MDILWNVLEVAWKILIAILVFGVIIFIHESGHFFVAKWCGIKVNEFALGMGPKILKKQGKETLYSLRLFPVGGFCSMEGEDESSESERAFCRKPVWKRILVVLAGAAMNVLLGYIILVGLTLPSEYVGTNVISQFKEGAVSSADGGIQVGDRIDRINGSKIFIDADIAFALTRDNDGTVDMDVVRDGQNLHLDAVHFTVKEQEGTQYMNIDFYVEPQENSFFVSMQYSFQKTFSIVRQVWLSFFDLITGKIPMQQLSGPVGVTQAIGNSATVSWDFFLTMVAFITINIGVFNLLPLPALDGGRFIFLVIEGIRRKPINPKYEGYVHFAGLMLLLLLIVFVTYNDILRLFG